MSIEVIDSRWNAEEVLDDKDLVIKVLWKDNNELKNLNEKLKNENSLLKKIKIEN